MGARAEGVKYIQTKLLVSYVLRYIMNLFSYALPFNEKFKNDKLPKVYVGQNLLFLFHVYTWDF